MGTHFNFNNLEGGGPPGGEGNSQMKPMGSVMPLARQSSLYSLTFDELQSTLGGQGKEFGSMNMDELLKSIWTAEEAQVMTMASSAAPAVAAQPGGCISSGNLQRHGSLTLPRTISQKTVDEVWKCLITKDSNIESSSGGGGESNVAPVRQQNLGEMTLEEFLFRAGVVREDNMFYGTNSSADDLGFGFGQPNQSQQQQRQQLNQPQQRLHQTIYPKQANVAFAAPVSMVNKSFVGGAGVTVAATSPGTSSAENILCLQFRMCLTEEKEAMRV